MSLIELISILDTSESIKKRYQKYKKKNSNVNKILEDIELPSNQKNESIRGIRRENSDADKYLEA